MNKTFQAFNILSILCIIGCTLPISVPLLFGTGTTLGIFSFAENNLERYILIFLALTTITVSGVIFMKKKSSKCHTPIKCNCGTEKN
ncbi:MAG: MerC domain-containing protein [Alphaproteobacteria bacterium]|nr:MerC domain-containing protein [Alphaproteobacteria bacterium]